jgi:anti-anti-sigma factor
MVQFQYNTEEKVQTVVFSGKMNAIEVANFPDAVASNPQMQKWQPGEKLVFDLKEVDYIASGFIRICVSYAKQAGPGNFSIINCQPFVKKTFKVSGLDEVLNIQ